MKKYLQKIMCIIVPVCLLCTGCSRQPTAYKSVDTAMGTIINQTIYISADEETAQEILDEVISCIDDLEKNNLSWRLETSEVYQINESAGSGQEIKMSSLLTNVLDQCKKVYAASNGAFDFTVGSVARLWNIDAWAATPQGNGIGKVVENATQSAATEEGVSEFILPTQEQLAEALTHVGGDKSRVEGAFVNLPEGMQLDLGAVGKGIVLDEVRKLLEQHEEVSGAVISAGGSILTYGSKPDGSNWNVGIVDPFNTSQNLGILSLKGIWCVSTSGDYERYVEVDGVRYHHILDPHTGMPADSGVKSVTILIEGEDTSHYVDGLFSDALSTACFVLGVEEGLKLAEEFGAEALFVDNQGGIFMTEGMEQYFHLSN